MTSDAAQSTFDEVPLDHNAARLLLQIHRGAEIRRTMSRADREIRLLALVKRGLVALTSSGAIVTRGVELSLTLTPGEEQPA